MTQQCFVSIRFCEREGGVRIRQFKTITDLDFNKVVLIPDNSIRLNKVRWMMMNTGVIHDVKPKALR